MVRFNSAKLIEGNTANSDAVFYKEGYCDSTDEKPVANDTATGSILVEVDTGKVFFFNEKDKTWVEQFSLKG